MGKTIKVDPSKQVVATEKLAECGICHDETIKITTADFKERIYANHIEGCPNQKEKE